MSNRYRGLKPWQPGQSGNPKGRQPGSRNKLGEQFICDLYDDWKAHGAHVIKEVRTTRPDVYLKVVAGILPRELHFKTGNAFDGLSDEAVNEIVDVVGREIASRTASGSPARSDTPSVSQKLN